ncbi:MAG: hypothetical protein DRO00_05970 [Thermoproteota archaeon]|nr:MAG: hypothetical protein DRO00_05970 [Candidatus Korarchaeota archaeon]
MRITASLIVLLIATLQDIKDREVDDIIWLIGLSLGGILDIFSLFSVGLTAQKIVRYLRFSIPFLFIILISWRFRLMGGADILAFITLAIIQPSHPLGKCMFPPAFCTMLYSNFLMLILPFSFLMWNLSLILKGNRIFDGFKESSLRKILASLFAIAVQAEKAKKFKFFSIAQEGSSPEKKFKLVSVLSIPETKEELPKTKEHLVWICPSVPMIPFILAGYVLTMLIGDPVLLLIEIFK